MNTLILGVLGIIVVIIGVGMVVIRFIRGHDDQAEADAKAVTARGHVGFVLTFIGLAALGGAGYLDSQDVTKARDALSDDKDKLEQQLEEANKNAERQRVEIETLKDTSSEKDSTISQLTFTNSQIKKEAENQQAARKEAENMALMAQERAKKAESGLSDLNEKLQSQTQRANVEAGRRDRAERALREALLLQQASRFSEAELERYKNLLDKTLSFNDQLQQIRLSETYWPVLTERGPAIRFAIERQDFDATEAGPYGRGVFGFRSMEYIIRDAYGDPITDDFRQALARNVCVAVEQAIIGSVPFLDALRAVDPDFEKFLSEDPVKQAMAEAVMLKVAVKLVATRALVLFRGYADGSAGEWQEELDRGDTEMTGHEIDRDSNGEMIFLGSPERIVIGDRSNGLSVYGNDDLPDLRALAAVRAIGALVSSCTFSDQRLQEANHGSIDVQGLEGRVYDTFNPSERKALGFLYIELG